MGTWGVNGCCGVVGCAKGFMGVVGCIIPGVSGVFTECSMGVEIRGVLMDGVCAMPKPTPGVK